MLAEAEEKLASLNEDDPVDQTMLETTQTKIDKLKEATDGFERIINHTDSVLARAAIGNLTEVTKLMPSILTKAVLDLEERPAPDAESKLEQTSAISFSGGGQKVWFSVTFRFETDGVCFYAVYVHSFRRQWLIRTSRHEQSL